MVNADTIGMIALFVSAGGLYTLIVFMLGAKFGKKESEADITNYQERNNALHKESCEWLSDSVKMKRERDEIEEKYRMLKNALADTIKNSDSINS